MPDLKKRQKMVDEIIEAERYDSVAKLLDVATRGVVAPEDLSLDDIRNVCHIAVVALGSGKGRQR